MAVELIIAPEASKDIEEAYAWYERQHDGLGADFFECVEACIQSISRTPKMHQTIHENYRRALVKCFPYAVFYESEGDTVTVYCVFHTSRDPEKWRLRLSD